MEYHPGTALYQATVLEQWKMLVETSERVSSRRSLANTFFLTINSVAITLLGIFWESKSVTISVWWTLLPLTILLLMCASWLLLIASYRRLNQAKFAVIHALEELLPARVFAEEWQIIKHHGSTRYVSFTAIEFVVPILFIATYVAGVVLVIEASL